MKKIALLFGGPSSERGISLNSARSVYDNIDKDIYDITLLYVNPLLERFKIPHTLIYSNTPMDFDFFLKSNCGSLNEDIKLLLLKEQDIVFPVIHGAYGEDGVLQKYLEDNDISFVGGGSVACHETSNKSLCQQKLSDNGWYTPQSYVLKVGEDFPLLESGKRVAKPLNGGSSIGVMIFEDISELYKLGESLFEHQNEYLLEPYCEGREFTLMVLENHKGEAVSLLPSEIEFLGDTFFDFRMKYLPTDGIRYHTPAKFDIDTITKIRDEAQKVFKLFNLKDGARLDGRLLDDGTIRRSDINAIMGMEQNSFLFHQTALFGLNHRQTIDYLIGKEVSEHPSLERKQIPVLFGGTTAERQVSVLSGTNVMMKLQGSQKCTPIAIFLNDRGEYFEIPYYMYLLHTTEEIQEKIQETTSEFISSIHHHKKDLLIKLGISDSKIGIELFIPRKVTLESLASLHDFIFLGLHGGDAENGVLQEELDTLGVKYNGPGSLASYLCNDKQKTKDAIDGKISGVQVAPGIVIDIALDSENLWLEVVKVCGTSLIIKPNDDGCSAGVVFVDTKEQFLNVMQRYKSGKPYIPAGTIYEGQGQVELPSTKQTHLLIEEFIKTDEINLDNLELSVKGDYGYIEVTVGVVGSKGSMIVLSPSLTVAESKTLSLEEKFMGGTGVNITPLPTKVFSDEVVNKCKEYVGKIVDILGIGGYSRLDLFLNRHTGSIILIEVNTLPALTPSTVIFHQALAEETPIYPKEFIEILIEST